MKRNYLSLVAGVGACLLAGALIAQNAGLQRTVVQRADVSVSGREAVIARLEVAPGIAVGRHTHAGDEMTYVLEGEGELLIDGQPPRKLKAGDAFVIPAGIVHDGKNTGTTPMKLVAAYVVEKGKPLATPAP
jgi:quercetin dioxygenase-like cupin family protein